MFNVLLRLFYRPRGPCRHDPLQDFVGAAFATGTWTSDAPRARRPRRATVVTQREEDADFLVSLCHWRTLRRSAGRSVKG